MNIFLTPSRNPTISPGLSSTLSSLTGHLGSGNAILWSIRCVYAVKKASLAQAARRGCREENQAVYSSVAGWQGNERSRVRRVGGMVRVSG